MRTDKKHTTWTIDGINTTDCTARVREPALLGQAYTTVFRGTITTEHKQPGVINSSILLYTVQHTLYVIDYVTGNTEYQYSLAPRTRTAEKEVYKYRAQQSYVVRRPLTIDSFVVQPRAVPWTKNTVRQIYKTPIIV